jgi:hypothetical protein
MAAPVMGDTAIAMFRQEKHLVFKGVSRERPAMAEHHGLTRSPILEINFRTVMRLECRHVNLNE